MKARLIGPMISGLVAVGLIVASAFVPWFEWSFRDGTEAQIKSTRIWGPSSYVPGTPFGSVEIPVNHHRVVIVSVCIYLILLLLGLALWTLPLLWTLAGRFGLRRAAFATGCGSAAIWIGIAVVAGLFDFVLASVGFCLPVRSTWIVPVELQRIHIEGPLLLLVGTVQAIATAVIAARLRQDCGGGVDSVHSPRCGTAHINKSAGTGP